MKLLKLTAPEGLKIAECLVGSRAINKYDKHMALIGLLDDYEFVLESPENSMEYYGDGIVSDDKILLPIDSLKFCPFIAMRNGVSTKLGSKRFKNYTITDFGDAEARMNFANYWFMGDMTAELDLTAIERGEVPGAEIIETEDE